MKTVISIPDQEFETAEKLAVRLGLSRSELYQKALADFIAKHSEEQITERLNAVYTEGHAEGVDDDLLRLQAQSIGERTR